MASGVSPAALDEGDSEPAFHQPAVLDGQVQLAG